MVHGCMVYTERAEMVAVSCGTSHASAVSTPLWWIFQKRAIKSYSLMQNHRRAQRVCSRVENSSIKKRSIIIIITEGIHSCKPASLNRPIYAALLKLITATGKPIEYRSIEHRSIEHRSIEYRSIEYRSM